MLLLHLRGRGRGRVLSAAVEADFAIVTFEGTDVTHLDGTDGKLVEEMVAVEGEVRHPRLVHARRVLQGLVAGDHALAPAEVLVVLPVELVRRAEVQIRQPERQVVGRLRGIERNLGPQRTYRRRVQEVAKFGVRLQVV